MAKITATEVPDSALRRVRNVVAATVLIIGIVLVSAGPASAATCLPEDIINGTCNISGVIDDDEVELGGEITAPGSPTGEEADGPGSTPPPSSGSCIGRGPNCGRDEFGVTAPLTLADIAHFRPNPGIDSMEPNGWMVVGLDTNFYSTGGVQIHEGELLGSPASVRFTPVRWHWTYGDGATATRSTPGGTWAGLGLREFDPTATSHVYRAPGTYYIDLTIDFSPEYRIAGGPWIDIPGVIPVPANRLVATAGGAKTVLVDRDCRRDPSGPGC
jgi:hypothetical protein